MTSRPSGHRDTRSLLKNSFAGMSGLLLSQAAAMFSAAYLGHKLGPGIVGVYAYSFAVASMALPLTILGMDQAIVREVAKNRKSAGKLLVSSLALRMPMCLLIYTALLLLLHFHVLHFKDGLPAGGHMLMFVVWLTLFTGSATQAAQSVFVGLERQEISSAITAIAAIARTGFTVLVVYLGLQLFHMGLVVLSVGTVAAIAMVLVLCNLTTVSLRPEWNSMKALASIGATFFVMDIFMAVVSRFDYVYLPTVTSRQQVGLYTASYTVLNALLAGSLAIDSALFPIITRRCQMGGDSVRRAWDIMHKYLAFIAVPTGVGIGLLAEQVMQTIYGHRFVGAGAVLRILIWSGVIFLPTIPSFRILVARNLQLRLLPFLVVRMIVNVAVNLFLAPRIGAQGSAIAMVVSESIYYGSCFLFPFRTIEMFPIARWYARPLLAGLAMAGVILLTRGRFHVVLTGVMGFCTYMVALFGLRAFGAEDIAVFRGAFKRGSVEADAL